MSASKEVITAGDVGTLKLTEKRSDRFKRLLKTYLPERAKDIDRGEWGPYGAPYRFLTLRDGSQRLVLERVDLAQAAEDDAQGGDHGPHVIESISVTGKTRDELLDRLDERLKAQRPAAPGKGQ